MKKRALSLILALIMCLGLAVPAMAADDGKELRMQHLDWTEDGQCYAGERVYDMEDPGMDCLEFNPYRGDHVIFFVYDFEKQTKEFVVPEGTGSVKVEKVDAEGIAPDAKDSEYYVRLVMEDWKDGAVTYDGLTFELPAGYNDFSFYSTQRVSQASYLGDWDRNVDELDNRTFYFMNSYTGKAAEGRIVVTAVEKAGEDQDAWKLSKVNSNCWKIVVNKDAFDEKDFIRVELALKVKDSEGNTWDDGQGIGLYYERPRLWAAWPEWKYDEKNDSDYVVYNPENGIGDYIQVWPGMDEVGLVFGTCEVGEDGPIAKTFKPAPASELEVSEGLTLSTEDIPYVKGDRNAKNYVTLSVDEFGKEYTVTWKGMSATISSLLPDVGVYRQPEATVENWMGNWGFPFSPAHADEVYYLISTQTDEANGRHLTGLALTPDVEENAPFQLAKVSDDVYSVTFQKDELMDRDFLTLFVDITWTDPDGNTWTDEGRRFGNFDTRGTLLAGDETLAELAGADGIFKFASYRDVGEKAFTQVTMTAGQEKEVHLYMSGYRDRGEDAGWMLWPTHPWCFYSSSEELSLRSDPEDYSKFTLSCAQPGEYTIYFADFDYSLTLYHEDGTEYTAEEVKAFRESPDCMPFLNVWGKLFLYYPEDGREVPYEGKYEVEIVPTPEIKIEAYPITVIVLPGETQAMPTNDALTADGELQNPTVYKIGGYNYFKIRDLAAILNGTGKQFSVDYDGEKNAVTTTIGQGYTKLDTDLAGAPEGGDKTAVLSNDTIYVDGEKIQAEVYKIDDMNYFKLRDLGKAFNFYVGYDKEKGMYIETDKPYSAE